MTSEDLPIPLSPELDGFISPSQYSDVIDTLAWELSAEHKMELLSNLQSGQPDGLELDKLKLAINQFSTNIDDQDDLDPAPEVDDCEPTASSDLQSPFDLEIGAEEDSSDQPSVPAGHISVPRQGEQLFEDCGGSQLLIDLSTPPPEMAAAVAAAAAAAAASGKPPLPPDAGANLQRGSEIRITWPRHRSRPASLGLSGSGASPNQSPSSRSPRSSARGSPQHRMQRRLSAVQLAQQLFNSSSGRSSPRTCGDGSISADSQQQQMGYEAAAGMSEADMAAIEMAAQFGDQMTDQLKVLTDQVSKLTSSQSQSDSRHSKLLEDNQHLQERLLRLEDEYRDAESRFNQTKEADKARAKEKLQRVTREKDAEIESLVERLRHQETAASEHRQEALRTRTESERFRLENARLEERLEAAEQRMTAMKEEAERGRELARRELEAAKRERDRTQAVLEELQAEVDAMRAGGGTGGGRGGAPDRSAELAGRYSEVEQLAKRLTQENRTLREQMDDLQAELLARGLEEGRALLRNQADGASLAAEMELLNKEELMDLLVREKDSTQKLRSYIDRILLKIMEKQPELLEIGMASSG